MMQQYTPLAERMRAQTLEQYVGQQHLLGAHKPLRAAYEQQQCHSMILWGPPGTGKTTLAYILANHARARVEKISAVLAGVKDIRAIVDKAQIARERGDTTVLFVDEVHRFSKSQQDAFLPHVEAGTIILIGATTENPSFALNNALLSRARVYVLRSIGVDDLLQLMDMALIEPRGLGDKHLNIDMADKQRLAVAADGDARCLLNMLEVMADFAESEVISHDLVSEVIATNLRRFDHQGDIFYDQISALHKSVRGSDPDAALYWFCRMIDGGCDPHYIARRILRMAHEDIGLADPRAGTMALEAWQCYERMGSPEGELALANMVIYLACAAKSNRGYTAYSRAMQTAKQSGSLEVPMHLRNAPTKLMKQLDYGKNYRYAHDEPGAFARGETYFPEPLIGSRFYEPVARGLEIKIKQKLDGLRQLNKEAKQ